MPGKGGVARVGTVAPPVQYRPWGHGEHPLVLLHPGPQKLPGVAVQGAQDEAAKRENVPGRQGRCTLLPPWA